MAASTPFKRDDPVLLFKLRDHVGGAPYEQRRYLLWPAWVYRVIAPSGENRRLNILQKAVLGLCSAGIFEIQRVADSLDIHANLAKEIILELQQEGLLNNRGLPTDKGKETLQDETISSGQSATVGHVFQDAITEELWPRFVQDLNYAELQYEGEHPRLVMGKTGKPFYQRAYQYLPTGVATTQPSPKQIIDTVRQHQRAKRYGVEWVTSEEDYISYADKELEGYLARVSIVDDAPQRMFLATYVYLDEADGDWYVCDPFGFGPSLFLRRNMDRQLKEPEAKGLREQVDGLLEKILGTSLEDIERWHEQLKERAELQVRQKIPYLSDNAIFNIFCELEFVYQRITEISQSQKQDARNIFRDGGLVLEGIFNHLILKYRKVNEWEILPGKDVNECKNVYIEIARSIGFNVEKYTPNLSRDNAKKAVKEGKSQGLWSLIIASTLVAHHKPDHPMHGAAAINPNLLDDLKELSGYRNDASHFNANEKIEIGMIHKYVESIYRIANLFFRKPDSTDFTGGKHVQQEK